MVEVLKKKSETIDLYISNCLSSSNICGSELRKSHYFLGTELAHQIEEDRQLFNKKIGLLIMMRAGLPFGFGLADALEKNNDVDILLSSANNDYSKYDVIIISDAVINTGKTIFEIIEKDLIKRTVIIATNVISDKYMDNFKCCDIFAVRISKNSYKGDLVKIIENGKGPDTGERLFRNTFYK